MNSYNDDPRPPQEMKVSAESQNVSSEVPPEGGGTPGEGTGQGYSITNAAGTLVYPPPEKAYPEDLQISWSWPHFLVFGVFVICLLVSVPAALLGIYGPHRAMTKDQLEQFMISRPEISIGGTLLIYGLVLFFLYVSLAMLRGMPFWSTVGWRKIRPVAGGISVHPLVFALTGAGLSIFVLGVTNFIQRPEKLPIDEVFKHRQTAVMFVAMAMLVAPLVEETVFRGYLYPMFARWFGVGPSVVLTGVLFGLMHGPQLGDAKSLIAIMSFVGVVFTLVRARTGSVFASYLMHLGYNSLIGVSLLLATHGFTQMPPAQ